MASIAIPLPDEAERLEFIRGNSAEARLPAGSDVTAEALAKLAAGLKRVQLQSLISHAVRESPAAHDEVPDRSARRN